AIVFWDGETKTLGDGLTLVRCGGHFEGGTVLHWQDGAGGKGALLTGDIIQVVADRRHVSFMYSYPNYVPLPAAAVERIVQAVESAGGYHHRSGLNTWESLGGTPPPPGTTGLYHTAILYPTRRALADALRRVLEADIQLDGASDHGVSEALYLRGPDDNGVE